MAAHTQIANPSRWPRSTAFEQIIKRHGIREDSAVFVVYEPVCGDQCVPYSHAAFEIGLQQRLSAHDCPVIVAIHSEQIAVELDFAHVDDVVHSAYQQVDLSAFLIVIPLRPGTLGCPDSADSEDPLDLRDVAETYILESDSSPCDNGLGRKILQPETLTKRIPAFYEFKIEETEWIDLLVMDFPFREAERNIFQHEIACNQWIQYGRKRTAVAELEVSGDFVPGETGVPAAEIYDYILDSVRVVEDGQEESVELIPELCTSCEEHVINVL